jgi:hypothetical protein
MRDIKRIDPMVEKFRELWKKYPDMRFGQLLLFIYSEFNRIEERDTFYIEDEKGLILLQEILDLSR